MSAAIRQARARARAPALTSILLITPALVAALAAPAGSLTLKDTGQWTPPYPIGQTAVHMALLRGRGLYGAQVVWWYGLNDEQGPFAGGLLGWKPTEHDCSSWSTSDTTFLVPISIPTPEVEVFCGSNSTTADGKLFIAGGTQGGTEFGLKRANVFDPSVWEWTEVDSMSFHRWYATSTSLATGAQLVTSGSHDHHLKFFGGLKNAETAPTDSALFRYGDGANGQHYDAAYPVAPYTLWPSPREGHTAVILNTLTANIFGGKDRSGNYLNDYWQLRTAGDAFDPDFRYSWTKTDISSPPPARWGHSAVATPGNPPSWMIVFGGIAKSPEDTTLDVAMNDVWRLWYNNETQRLTWSPVSIQGTELPARCGHVALWRKATSSDLASDIFGRMLMFGGRGTPTADPSDSALWSLNFTDTLLSTATWEKLEASGPGPRFHPALGYDDVGLPDTAFVFGGEAAGGQKLNDLWRLNVNSLTWAPVNYLQGTPPSVRSRATATLAANVRLLFVFGGRSDDSTVHVAQLGGVHGAAQTWTSYRPHSPALTGHVAFFEGQQWARIPEVFTPSASGGSWTRLDNAPHLQTWYPQGFVWKADTVFFSGPELFSYKLAMNNQTWRQFPGSSSGFRGGTAVMYRPGRVMKCGSSDWEVQNSGDVAVGTTKSLYLGAPDSAQWRPSANPMQPRENHNLVLLPDGRVMVVGGSGKAAGAEPKKGPEIWDPDFNNGQGRWSGYDTLAAEHRVRDYHSTALLLPDGRVLSGGGNQLPDQHDFETFCPPYLFNSDGTLATRPGISSTIERVRYGDQFSICLPTTGSIAKVGLIRPGAVTHGFDQNQRYVPLTFGQAGTRVNVIAPPDSFIAPPGDYMLFIVNAQGVPAIARWMRVGSVWNPTDVTAPDSIPELHADMLTTNGVNLVGTVTGDDHMDGTASYVDVRYSLSPINDGNWNSAQRVSPEPIPACSGQSQSFPVSGLAPGHTYYFALKFGDDNGNWSALGDTAIAPTLPGECCSGEVRASRGREEDSAAPDGLKGPAAANGARPESGYLATAPAGNASLLIVSAVPAANGLDLEVIAVDQVPSGAEASLGSTLHQTRENSGAWTTQFPYDPPPGDRLALCVPANPTRWVFLQPFAVKYVPPILGGSEAWIMDGAHHSTLGDVTTALSAGEATPELAAGDTLTVHYAPAPESTGVAPPWLLVLDRPAGGTGSTRAIGRRPDPVRSLPRAFALHQNLPNPFAGATRIGFAIPIASRVKLEVYDLLGRRVRTLTNGFYPPGEHEVAWDRRSTSGALASPGLYFYRMDAGQYREKKRMVILP